jgi:glutathione S-transferase
MTTMTLHDIDVSTNCYKVRLFMSLIGQPLDVHAVNYLAGEHKPPRFWPSIRGGKYPCYKTDR